MGQRGMRSDRRWSVVSVLSASEILMVIVKEQSAPADHLCPKHKTKLVCVLRGGAGYCTECRLYTQADGIPMPTLDQPTKPTKQKRQARKATRKTMRKAVRGKGRASSSRKRL